MPYYCKYSSPFGEMTMMSDGENLTGLWFDGQKYFPEMLPERGELPIFDDAGKWLDVYFSGDMPDFQLPIKFNGTLFRREVWEILQTIPYGETMTYGEIASEIAEKHGLKRMSAQAVGGAVGCNPISIIVPCHRVIGSDGSLIGYAGGLHIKKALLELEHKKDLS